MRQDIKACFPVLFFFLLILQSDTSAQQLPGHNEPVYTTPRVVRYGFSIENTTEKVLEDVEFRTYAPVKQTSTQKVVQLTSSVPYTLSSDELGNQVLHFTLQVLPPHGTQNISVTAKLMLAETPNTTIEQDVHRYLKEEPYIETGDPIIKRRAKKLARMDPVQTALATYNWVATNVRYPGYIPDDRGASYAIRHKIGDCTESAYLFAALARVNRIPTRMIGGYVSAEDAILKAEDYHNWAEFYVEGKWHLADPQKKKYMEHQRRYIAMRVFTGASNSALDNSHRFASSEEGLRIKMR